MNKRHWMVGLLSLAACTGSLDLTSAASEPSDPLGADETTDAGEGAAPNDDRPPTGTPTSSCGPIAGTSPTRRLNRIELAHAVEDVFGISVSELFSTLPPDGTLGGFATVGTQLSSGELFSNAYIQIAESLADKLVREGVVEYACASKEPSAVCFSQTFLPYARILYRDVSTAELSSVIEAATATAALLPLDDALRVGIAAMLASPRFLFTQNTQPAGALSGTALATRLALTLWLSVPDETLLTLAEDGSLLDAQVLEAELTRMMADARFDRFLRNFFHQSFTLDRLKNSGIDPNAFALGADELRTLLSDMEEETLRFVRHVWDEQLPVDALISSRTSFVNERLARHYGLNVDVPSDASFVRVELPVESDRRGLLTQGAILTQAASGSRASVVVRGDLVLSGILCQPPPPPPPSFEDAIEELAASGGTEREKTEVRAARPECAGCHRAMDPIGLALSGFDPLGRSAREGPDGEAIDTSTTLDDTPVRGASELTDVLLKRDRVSACMTEKLLIYSTGRGFDPNRKEDACVIEEVLSQARTDGTDSLKDMVRALVLTPAFRLQGTQIDDGTQVDERGEP